MTLKQLNQLLKANPVGPFGYFRYVRVGDEFRFADIESNLAHCKLCGNDIATGAGFIRVHSDWMLVEGRSMTLDIGPGPDDEEKLSELLGLPVYIQ